jgi:hypothetical protein
MPQIIRKKRSNINRVTVFKQGGLRLLLDTRDPPRPGRSVGAWSDLPEALLELQQQDSRHPTKWNSVWSGLVSIEPSRVTIKPVPKGS